MKYFFGSVTTDYMGMEWGQDFLIRAHNEGNAFKRSNVLDWTHGDGVEEQEEVRLREIPATHFEILKQYLLVG